MKAYAHKKIEKKWQEQWEKEGLYTVSDNKKGKKNFYSLVEFPYPSGNLHIGHWYAFSVPDIFVRARRMQGANILFPIGFDAFGLPAENAALKHGANPRTWTYENIDYMRKQLRSMGASFDWSREVVTSDSEYYRWTQWLFLQLFHAKLAYQAETAVNWCPNCKTVLANEQVVQGTCERCRAPVEQKRMKQWLLRITNYAEKLLEGLETLDWKEEIKEAQRNWIGKSEGARLSFEVTCEGLDTKHCIEVFTTRPDTLFGATYLVVAPEHELLANDTLPIVNKNEVDFYIKKARGKTELERQQYREKTGVELKGIRAVNPATGEDIPVWVADYVLGGYGTGAIMAVPAHDKRDWEFAKAYHLPVKKVILKDAGDNDELTEAYSDHGILVHSERFDGMDSEAAKKEITEFVGGIPTAQYKLRDWVVSRQRYWGVPIPVVHCVSCGAVGVRDTDLPVELPDMKDYKPAGDGKSPLAKAGAWLQTSCPKCGGKAERETDTLDTFVDSSWYFLRYCDPKNTAAFASKEKMKCWMPVDLYSGGAEHTTMHLLYSRFFMKALCDLGFVKWSEPYVVRKNRGIILGSDNQKMSKSRGNVVDPDEYVARLGSDTVRMYLAFIGPYDEVGASPWDPRGILGIRRFLDRVWKLQYNLNNSNGTSEELEKLLHQTIKKVTSDIENFKFNTAIAVFMTLLNLMEKSTVSQHIFCVFLQLLAPFAPHITEELWKVVGNKESIHQSAWPVYEEEKTKAEALQIAVQVNGKLRDIITVSGAADKEKVTELALASSKVAKYVKDGHYKKIIFVEGRLINILV